MSPLLQSLLHADAAMPLTRTVVWRNSTSAPMTEVELKVEMRLRVESPTRRVLTSWAAGRESTVRVRAMATSHSRLRPSSMYWSAACSSSSAMSPGTSTLPAGAHAEHFQQQNRSQGSAAARHFLTMRTGQSLATLAEQELRACCGSKSG